MSTPAEFVTAAFASLADAASIAIDQYFVSDPDGITYVKVALREISVDVMSMHLEITWAGIHTISHDSQGPDAWQSAVATALLGVSPL